MGPARVSRSHTYKHKNTFLQRTLRSLSHLNSPKSFLEEADDPSASSQSLQNNSHTHTYTILAPLTAGQDWLTVTLKDSKDLVGGVYRVTNSFIFFRSFSNKSRSVNLYCSFWIMIAHANTEGSGC